MSKVLVIGSGGREHAIAWKLSQSSHVDQVIVSPGNDGMQSHAECVSLETHNDILRFAKENAINLVFIGQEQYLVDGLADQLRAQHIHVVGPSSSAAALEGSKSFAKNFMHRHGIPTASYESFNDPSEAIGYLKTISAPYVIKADGLAAGKGVFICKTLEDGIDKVNHMLQGQPFGEASKQIVIEEFMEGEEASYFVFTDGKNYVTCPSSQDHKRIGELDMGLNTGGMGAYAPAPVMTPEVEQQVIEKIVQPTISGMAQEGTPYSGILYIGLMIKNGNARVVEYNCRFGDPECQALMMLLKSDFYELSKAVATQQLDQVTTEWSSDAAVCLTLASKGYPQDYQSGKVISGLETLEADSSKSVIFHAGTKKDGNTYRTAGGRVLGITTVGSNLEQALNHAYQQSEAIHWDGKTYRRDIGLKGLSHETAGRPEKSVAIVIGSISDLEIAKKATKVLEQFGVGYRLCVTSAHRTPERTRDFIKQSEEMGVEVFIAMAGMAAHLPGVVAAETTKPVIGVPIKAALDGLDSMLAIAQMPPGVPVATVAVNGGMNAAILATQTLALRYPDLRAKLRLYKLEMAQKVCKSHEDANLEVI